MRSESRAAAKAKTAASPEETRVPVASDADIVKARQKGRELAFEMGFQGTDPTLIAAAISEVARNILLYARSGEIILKRVHRENGDEGIVVVARDEGPGVRNVDQVMEVGYSTSRSLGLGLPGAKRLMDEFEIVSQLGQGTTVTMKKWRRK